MSNSINLIRDDLRDFSPYSSARKEVAIGRVWLNANELPWGDNSNPGKAFLNRYPEQQPEILINKMAEYYAVDKEEVLATRGSDEGIDLLIRLFCEAGKDGILLCPPTFGMYEVCAKLQGAQVIKVPLSNRDFALDSDAIMSVWNPKVKLIFLCSPNNPTGNLICTDKIIYLCEKLAGKSIVVIDEAYIEFAQAQSLSKFINKFDNLVVLRTLSKAFGLAAARVGILLANKAILSWLKKILPPYPLSELSIQEALKAFQESGKTGIKVELIIEERDRLLSKLRKLKITEYVWPSSANFIFIKFKRPIELVCIKQGIVLRNMETKTGIENCMRITIGTPGENLELINLLRLYQE